MKIINKYIIVCAIILTGCQSYPPTDSASMCMYQAVKNDRILLVRNNARVNAWEIDGSSSIYSSKKDVCASQSSTKSRLREEYDAYVRPKNPNEIVIVDPVAQQQERRRIWQSDFDNCMLDPNITDKTAPAKPRISAYQNFEKMVSGLKLIDLNSCPADFVIDFNSYINNWTDRLALARQNPNLTINNYLDILALRAPENNWQKTIINQNNDLNKAYAKVRNLVCEKTNWSIGIDPNQSFACK